MGRYTGDALRIALQLAAPVLLTLFLIDISFGMIGKVASGIRVHTESQPIKSLVGLGMVFLTLGYVLNRLPEYFAGMIQTVSQLMRNIQ
jgi:flagellar biosynthesis protein FliR